MLLTVTALATLVLGACGNNQKSSSDSSTKSSKVVKKAPKKEKPAAKSSKKVATKPKPKVVSDKMNFAQIEKGDFSSLTGTWTEIAGGGNGIGGFQMEVGDGRKLSLTPSTIKTMGMSVSGTTLTDNNGAHKLEFDVQKGALFASLQNDAAINWGVTFYPKNTTSAYSDITGTPKNTQNLIEVWTSNNSATQVFAQNVTAAQFKAMQAKAAQGMHLDQVAQNDFSSLVGTWKNPQNGDTIVVTSQVQNRTADSAYPNAKGAVISGQDVYGQHEVLMNGERESGTMHALLGYFSNKVPGTNVSSLLLVPKGVTASIDDDSDSTQDRMILGGGEGGYAEKAYYLVK